MLPILFISDIHSDMRALDAVLSIAADKRFVGRYGAYAKVVCLGDVVERYEQPMAVVERLRSLPDMDCVLGNHDEALIVGIDIGGGNSKSRYVHRHFKQDGGCEFFRGMPTMISYPELNLAVAHGGINMLTPVNGSRMDRWLSSHTWQRLGRHETADQYEGYMYTAKTSFDTAKKLFRNNGQNGNFHIVVVGHNHAEMAFQEVFGVVEELTPLAGVSKQYNGEHVMFLGRLQQHKYRVRAKTVRINGACNYQFAIGATSRYRHMKNGVDSVCFAMLHDNREQFTMFDFEMT